MTAQGSPDTPMEQHSASPHAAAAVPRPLASRARRFLHLFGHSLGPAQNSFEMLGRESGELVDTIDIEIGGASHDLCIDAVYYPLLAAVIAGYYSGMHAGIPCSKRSVNLEGHTALFTRAYPDGVPWASDRGQSDIFTLNLLTERTATLALVIKIVHHREPRRSRGLEEVGSVLPPRVARPRAPMAQQAHDMAAQLDPDRSGHLPALRAKVGGLFQKFTTLWYSAHLGVSLSALSLLKCAHFSHPGGVARGYDTAGRSRSRMAGVYPRRLNLRLLNALIFGAHLSAAGAPEVSSPAAADGEDEPACWPTSLCV